MLIILLFSVSCALQNVQIEYTFNCNTLTVKYKADWILCNTKSFQIE